MSKGLVVITTVEKREDGERLARLILEQELAACAQILPSMMSIYRWQGSIEQTAESLILIKTTRDAYLQLEALIKQNHPYQTPEIVAIPIEMGSEDYLAWLYDSVRPD